MPPIQEFHLFKQLPPELRIIIWKLILAQSERPGVHYVSLDGWIPNQVCRVEDEDIARAISQPPWYCYPIVGIDNVRSFGEVRSACLVRNSMWSVCAESREIISKHLGVESPVDIQPREGSWRTYTEEGLENVTVNRGGERIALNLDHSNDLFIIPIADLTRMVWWHRITQRPQDPRVVRLTTEQTPPLQNVGIYVRESWLLCPGWRRIDIFLDSRLPGHYLAHALWLIHTRKFSCRIWLHDSEKRKQPSRVTSLSSPQVFQAGRGLEWVETEVREGPGVCRTEIERVYVELREMSEGLFNALLSTSPTGPDFRMSTYVGILALRRAE